MTSIEFCNKIKDECHFLTDNRIPENQIQLLDTQIEILLELFRTWGKNDLLDVQKELVLDVIRNMDIRNGKVYEALVYAWLEAWKISYEPQVYIEQKNCMKKSSKGYYSDGVIKNRIYFDIKQFGLTIPHVNILRRELQKRIPEYYLTLSGGNNISDKDLQHHFLERLDDLASCIKNSIIQNNRIYRDSQFGIEFHLNDWEDEMYVSISEFFPYEWAQNNEFYFMYHSSQFCINAPYIIFCPYDVQLVSFFSTDRDCIPFVAFRALCRRIFMNLTKMENRNISEFDGKARDEISVAYAAKMISAIVFMDVSKRFSYPDTHTFVFINPNAIFKLSDYQIHDLFINVGAIIEDFKYDNY